ncbi:MAG: 4a-hydroxytetrahydrobiopterin dehydratase [Betaproteobacteria bacterium]|nr:4a-hydroxytetrahydrobiopterin dehydratase [Betaproteobacteria bacterium]NBY04530.1 4a-hydroxytetrahydrobiopterin dehydratase [Betaproteobacteria bacterium]
MSQALDPSAIASAMPELPGWAHHPEQACLSRDWQFADFVQAFGFVTQVALLAQALDHHPDWSQSYDRVSIRLRSHDAAGVTLRDIDMARRINAL